MSRLADPHALTETCQRTESHWSRLHSILNRATKAACWEYVGEGVEEIWSPNRIGDANRFDVSGERINEISDSGLVKSESVSDNILRDAGWISREVFQRFRRF